MRARNLAAAAMVTAAVGIVADVEVLPAAAVATAVERLARGDVRYRFVLDLRDLDVAEPA